MTYLPPINGGRINATISGNTAGVGALVSSGTLTLAGGNNVTLSQNGNAITIAGANAAGSNTFGISNLGNSAGTSGMVSGSAVRFALAGGNNITLSQSINAASGTITISGANQSIQTQNVHNMTLAGNTAGVMAQVSSGTLTLAGGNNITLSQNGNAVTISGAAGGGGGGIALANSQAVFTSGTANLAVAGGAMTIGTAANQSFQFSVPNVSSLSATGAISISTNAATISIGAPAFSAGVSNIGNTAGISGTASNQIVFAGGNNVTLSQSTAAGGNTITISAGNGGGGAMTNDFYQNMDRGASAVLAVPFNSTGGATLMLQRLNQENDKFAANITANTVLLNVSASLNVTSVSTGAHTMTAYIGIYSDNVTALSLINSASTSWGISANASNSATYHGARWLSFVSSQWSSAPNFVEDSEYVFGVFLRATNVAIPMSYIGQSYMMTAARSGSLGQAAVANGTLAQGNYWNATYSAAVTAFPATIASNAVTRSGASAAFMPHIILNNRYSGTF
jgi:hypothetical protein